MHKDDFLQLAASGELSSIPMVCTIGVFDGVHLGHQKIITTCVSYAKEHGFKSMAITFSRNPKIPLGEEMPTLVSPQRKEELLALLGVDYMVVIDFSSDISKLAGVEFLNLLGAICTLKGIVVGKDFRCGTPASCAGCEQLQEYLERHGSGNKLIVTPYVRLDNGQRISSSLVRRKLKTGNFPLVEKMLGRPYSVDVRALASQNEGQGLWYPVKRLGQLLPPTGQYMADAILSDGEVRAGTVRLTDTWLNLEIRNVALSLQDIHFISFMER